MTRGSAPAVAWWARAAVLVALAGHAVVLAIWPAAHTLLIDLEVYRAGGEHVLRGQPLYAGGVLLDLPFVYPPAAAVLFAPLVLLPLGLLKIVWTVLGVGLLALVVRRSAQSLGVAAGSGLVAATAAGVALATWLDPVRTTLYLGQINIVLLALVVGDLTGRPDSRWRGVGLGVAAAVKLTPLLFVAYLVLVGRVRAASTAVAAFVAVGLVGFLVAPADSVTYWLRGTFAAADRISAVAATSNHSLHGLLARALGGGAATGVYLVGAAVLVAVTLALAVRAHRRDQELLALTLCGLCSAAVAPFAWSHHFVWVVPLVVLLGQRAARGGRAARVLLIGVLAATAAVLTALPGPAVGPIPRTGLISLAPDVYLVLFVVVLLAAAVALRPAAPATAPPGRRPRGPGPPAAPGAAP